MTTPHWVEDAGADGDSPWNHCLLGDVELPGIIEVTVNRSSQLDEQNPKGLDGAFVVDEGSNLARVTISVLLLTKQHLLDYERAYAKIYPKTHGKKRDPLGILHPECTLKGVESVIIESIDGDPPKARSGKREIIECLEYITEPKKPKKKTGKGSAAKPASRPGPFVDPLTGRALDQEFTPKGVEATDFLFQGT